LLREGLLLIVATEEWTMRKTTKSPGEKIVKDIKRATRKHYSSEEKIRIVLDGLRGEDSIAELCRREGISQGIYYKWSKDFIEVVAEQTLELRLLKKSMFDGGGDHE
jgi:transposase